MIAFASTAYAASGVTGSPQARASVMPDTFQIRACNKPPVRGLAQCASIAAVPDEEAQSQADGVSEGSPETLESNGNPSVIFKQPIPGSLTPQDLDVAYSLPAETPSSSLQTIALIDAFNDPTAERDLATFDTQFGLPSCTAANTCLRTINEHGHAGPLPRKDGGWAYETSIDLEMAHAICQGCRLLLVEARSEAWSDLGQAVNAAAAADASEINNSYESTSEENEQAPTLAAQYYDHPGIIVTASAGDCGYLGQSPECEGPPAGVSFPASAPGVISVGGTTLSEDAGSWASSVWSGSGGGCSSIFNAPAWQTEASTWIATGCGTARLVADTTVVGDPRTGVAVYDSTPLRPGGPRFGWSIAGGTSVSAPIIAAEFGLAGGSLGVAYPSSTLYAHLGDARALYDIQSGGNGVCGGALACQAAPGYDGPSGVGSPVGLDAFSLRRRDGR